MWKIFQEWFDKQPSFFMDNTSMDIASDSFFAGYEKGLGEKIYYEDVERASIEISNLITSEYKTFDISDDLHDKIIDVLEKLTKYPEFRNHN